MPVNPKTLHHKIRNSLCYSNLFYRQHFIMAFDFSGRKILVTGATKGVGRELTKSLVEMGAEVYALGRNEEDLTSLIEECAAKLHPMRVDLADWDATRTALEELPVMNGLVNNAGILSPYANAVDIPKEEFERIFSVNLYAALNATQVVGKKMAEEGKGGSIVNVSSISSMTAMKGDMAYSMSKAALDMATRHFSLDLGPSNIRVNSVNPTVMLTPMTIGPWTDSERGRSLKDQTPLGRYAEVKECVNLISFLLSEYSSMITGTTNLLDGGLLSSTTLDVTRTTV